MSARSFLLAFFCPGQQENRLSSFTFRKVPQNDDAKTTVACAIPNAPGTLLKIVSVFSQRGIDICKIDTRPSLRAGSLLASARPFEFSVILEIRGLAIFLLPVFQEPF